MEQFKPKPQQQKRKFKVLCLHGYMTNAKLMEYQLKQWIQVYFKKDIEFVFLQGLYKLPNRAKIDPKLAEVINQTDNQLYSWTHPYFTDQEATFKYIVDYANEHGPFDGILGFSQGGYMTFSTLLRIYSGKLKLDNMFKFAIFVCTAFSELPHSYSKFGQSMQLPIPSMHLIGDNDFLYQGSLNLSTFFENPQILYHNSGHKIPRLDKEQIQSIKNTFGIIRYKEKQQKKKQLQLEDISPKL